MVAIDYDRKCLRVTVKGHAGTAPAGMDLVCAAVSTLTYTLAVNVKQLHRWGKVAKPKIRLEKGDAEISCVPVCSCRSMVKDVFEAVCIGFALLAEKYPDAVSYHAHT